MAFNNNKLVTVAKLFEVDKQTAESIINNQAKYLKVAPAKLLNSYFALARREVDNYKSAQARKKKLHTKNPLIQKYSEEIRELYEVEGWGYLKISRAMKINHNADISKSAIENFVKQNNLIKGGENG